MERPARSRTPERKCIATGDALSREEGVRFVLSPDGEVAPDFSGKLPGRGAWVTASREALETAMKRGGFARSFKAGVAAPEDLGARVETGLASSALSALGLARRANEAVIGFEKVRAALKSQNAAVLVNAVDGSVDGRRKLDRLGSSAGAAVVELFTEAEMASALGRDAPTVHVALKAGPGAMRFLREARKLAGFRPKASEELQGAARPANE